MRIIITEDQLRLLKSIEQNKLTSLNECVIAAVRLDDATILAKNRDRGYIADIELVHELIDGTEVLYWHDKKTDWSEGINEYKIGIVNSTLSVVSDEKEGTDKDKGNDKSGDKGKNKKPSYDGMKIRKALSFKTPKEVIKSIISYSGEDKKEVGVKGETIVGTPNNIYVIENTSKHTPIITKIKDDSKVVVRTNHGIYHKGAGYTSGEKAKSSHSRYELAKTHLRDAKTEDDVMKILQKQYKRNPIMNPYRKDNKMNMHTTGQIMMNLDNLHVTIKIDESYGEFDGYVNLLPDDYKAKIRFTIIN